MMASSIKDSISLPHLNLSGNADLIQERKKLRALLKETNKSLVEAAKDFIHKKDSSRGNYELKLMIFMFISLLISSFNVISRFDYLYML